MTEFHTLAMDPPWVERGGGKIKRGADRHYPLVKTADLPGVVHGSDLFRPARNAHLWMWATNNKLEDALWLGAELGFTYKTNAVWVKTHGAEHIADLTAIAFDALREGEEVASLLAELRAAMKLQIGLGQYLRGSHELLLFFTHGKGQDPSAWCGHRDVPSVIRARRTKHSAKPVEAYEMIERVSQPARVEFFAREQRSGWTTWGNEIIK